MAHGRALKPVLATLALLAPLVATFVPLGMAPLSALLVVVGLVALRAEHREWRIPGFAWGFVAVFCAWGLIGCLWSLDPWQTAKTTLRLSFTALVGMFAFVAFRRLERGTADALVAPLAVGIALAVGVILFDAVTGHYGSYLFRLMSDPAAIRPFKSIFTRGATIVGMLSWPLALLLWRRGRVGLAVLSVLGVAGTLIASDSGSAKMAQLVGVAAAAAVWFAPRFSFVGLRAALVVAAVTLPVVFASVPSPAVTFQNWEWLPFSWHHRVTIWNFTALRIAEKPLFGWAVDAARTIPGADEELDLRRYDANGAEVGHLIEAMLPLHPHNAFLQWWLELGAAGTALMVAFQYWLLKRIQALPDRDARAAAAAIWTSAFVISLASYGFWQSWWQGSIWLTACLAALWIGPGRPDSRTLKTEPSGCYGSPP